MAIEASDGKNKVTINAIISVIRDLHVPKFGSDKYTVTINENRPVGDTIETVTATDDDIQVSRYWYLNDS